MRDRGNFSTLRPFLLKQYCGGGWFSTTDDYKILTSPRLQNALTYLTAGVPLLLPTQTEYAPAPDALAWHRKNVYKK